MDEALRRLLDSEEDLTAAAVRRLVVAEAPAPAGVEDPTRPPARILTPYEVYVKGYKVNLSS